MTKLPDNIYTANQIRQFEQLSYQYTTADENVLMERAGLAAYQFMRQHWPQAKKIDVICGPGNNGGDGYVLARFAQHDKLDVTVWQLGNHRNLKSAAELAYAKAVQAGVSFKTFTEETVLSGDVIIDAIFGTGLNKPVTGIYAMAIDKINQSHLPILAIDIPSGLHADHGTILDHAIHATATITFIGVKLGLLTASGPAVSGEIVYDDMQLSQDFFREITPLAKCLALRNFEQYLLPRSRDAHKGKFGHVLVIGGDYGMPGAVRMAGETAMRIGAGLVTVATRPEHIATVTASRPELMCHGIKKPEDLIPLIQRANVIAIGPGLGRSATWSKEIFAFIMQMTNLPLVVDADALYWLSQFELSRENWVLTPHPGEAARLLQIDNVSVQENRLAALGMLQAEFGGVIVLKGAGSLVLGESKIPGVCTAGNPGMATGGMGDILTGAIAGLIAQGIPLETAAQLGVLVHAMAGDIAAKLLGERGLLATDLLMHLHHLVNQYRRPE